MQSLLKFKVEEVSQRQMRYLYEKDALARITGLLILSEISSIYISRNK